MLLLPLRITQGEPKRDLQPRPRYLFKLSLEEIGIESTIFFVIKSGFSLSPKKKKNSDAFAQRKSSQPSVI